LFFGLDSNGNVSNPLILNSVPEGTFDDATLAAISRFRFDPPQPDPKSAQANMLYTITYALPTQE
jgi:TonB family protein